MLALWLLTIYFLGTVLFNDSTAYRHRIGQVNISKEVKEHPKKLFPEYENAHCARVTYPSLTIHYGPVDARFISEAVDEYNLRLTHYFFAHMTVNFHGRSDYVEATGRHHNFPSAVGFSDSFMFVCVHRNPLTGAPDFDMEQHLTVDWIVFDSYISKSSDLYGIDIVGHSEKHYWTGLCFLSLEANISTALINTFDMNVTSAASGMSIWVDSLSVTEGNKYTSLAAVCAYIPNLPDEVVVHVMIVLSVITDGISINYSEPPLPNTYLTENGNIKLEAIESCTTNWTLSCVDKPFIQNYTSTPFVFISISFRDKRSSDVTEPAIVGWVEFANEVGFRACVSRPISVGEIPSDTSTPYLEYLVISQDGIYEEAIETNFSEMNTTAFITIELELPRNPIKLLVDSYTLSDGMLDLLASVISGALVFEELAAAPVSSNKVYLFYFCDTNTTDEDVLTPVLNSLFPDGYLPFVNYTGYAQSLINAVYPNGKPTTDEEKASIKFWVDYDCRVGPFNDGVCSLAACDGVDISGMKNITREKLTPHNSSYCPPLSIEIPCNLPPCTMQQETFFNKLQRSGFDGGSRPSGSINLIWFWALIGIVAVIGISCYASCVFAKKNQKNLFFNKTETQLSLRNFFMRH